MRIGELAQQSGVAVPTIKYYLRMGLLAAGAVTARNQALYDETHLRRLRLIRTLIDIGGLSVETIRSVLEAAADPRVPVRRMLAMLEPVRAPVRRNTRHEQVRAATRQQVAGRLARPGTPLKVRPATLELIVDICTAAHLLDLGDLCELIDQYAAAAVELAAQDVKVTQALAERLGPAGTFDAGDLSTLRESLVVAAVLGGALKATVHRAASTQALPSVALGELSDAS
jgi:DNA-binding transcriptional MerR regulator